MERSTGSNPTPKKTEGQRSKRHPGVQGSVNIGPHPVEWLCCPELGLPGIHSHIQQTGMEHPLSTPGPGASSQGHSVNRTKPCPPQTYLPSRGKGNQQESNTSGIQFQVVATLGRNIKQKRGAIVDKGLEDQGSPLLGDI